MPVPCPLCNHPQRDQFTSDLLGGSTYRRLAELYHVRLGTISSHVRRHLAAPLRRILESEQSLAADLLVIEPARVQLERLHQRLQRIQAITEAQKNWPVAIQAARESRKTLIVLARILGELQPYTPAAESDPVTIHIVREPLPMPAERSDRIVDAAALPEPDQAA